MAEKQSEKVVGHCNFQITYHLLHSCLNILPFFVPSYGHFLLVRGKNRISFVLVQDLIVTSRQNRKWQGSLLADSNQTKTSTNTNQKQVHVI